jgi:hypothetical protein
MRRRLSEPGPSVQPLRRQIAEGLRFVLVAIGGFLWAMAHGQSGADFDP